MTRGQRDINEGNKVNMKVDRFSMDVMMVSWIYMNVKTYQNIYFNYVHFIAYIFMLLKQNIPNKICISYYFKKISYIDFTTFFLMPWEGRLASVVKNISKQWGLFPIWLNRNIVTKSVTHWKDIPSLYPHFSVCTEMAFRRIVQRGYRNHKIFRLFSLIMPFANTRCTM